MVGKSIRRMTTGRWGDDHKHDGVPVHPGCYGCMSCWDCLCDEESPCYVPVTEEELRAALKNLPPVMNEGFVLEGERSGETGLAEDTVDLESFVGLKVPHTIPPAAIEETDES